MTISTGTQLRPLVRIGSAFLVACAIVAVLRLLQQDNVPLWGWWVLGIVYIPWCTLFGYAAITGRAPRWFNYVQSKHIRPDATL